MLQPRPSEPWWETQQRALTKRAAAAAEAARGGGGGPGGGGGAEGQELQLQQRERGGLAGGDPMVAMAASGSRCRVCQAPTTTRCGKCKSVSYW